VSSSALSQILYGAFTSQKLDVLHVFQPSELFEYRRLSSGRKTSLNKIRPDIAEALHQIATMTDLIGNAFSSVQGTATGLIKQGQGLIDRVLPPEKRADITAKLTKLAQERPGIFSFALSHIALSGFPIVIFVAFTITVAIVALLTAIVLALLGAVLFIVVMAGFALIVLFPILLFTTFVAVSVWMWGWGAYYLLKYFNDGEIPGIHSGLVEGLSKEAKGWWQRDDAKQLRSASSTSGQDKPDNPIANGSASSKASAKKNSAQYSSAHDADSDNKSQGTTSAISDGHADNKAVRRHPGHKVQPGSRATDNETETPANPPKLAPKSADKDNHLANRSSPASKSEDEGRPQTSLS